MDNKKEFWDRLGKTRAGMLETGGRMVPMSPSCAPQDGYIWFLTAKGTEAAEAAKAGERTRFAVCDTSNGIHADIKGTLALSHDKEKLDEVWNFVAASWYEDGKKDDDIVLFRLEPSEAEVWINTQNSAVFLYEVVKGNVTDKKPDMGENFTLSF